VRALQTRQLVIEGQACMKIRRVKHNANLRDVAIDGFDMFLLTLVEDQLSLTQLVEMAPRDALECVRHVLHLKQLGLLAVDFDSFDEQLLLVRVGETAANDALDNARTLRPPPKRSQPQPAMVIGSMAKPSTGMRAKPTPADGTPTARKAR
jgi:hypothetical protein